MATKAKSPEEGGIKIKGDKPPDLTLHNAVRREGDQGENGDIRLDCREDIEGSHCQADILHEVADG